MPQKHYSMQCILVVQGTGMSAARLTQLRSRQISMAQRSEPDGRGQRWGWTGRRKEEWEGGGVDLPWGDEFSSDSTYQILTTFPMPDWPAWINLDLGQQYCWCRSELMHSTAGTYSRSKRQISPTYSRKEMSITSSSVTKPSVSSRLLVRVMEISRFLSMAVSHILVLKEVVFTFLYSFPLTDI